MDALLINKGVFEPSYNDFPDGSQYFYSFLVDWGNPVRNAASNWFFVATDTVLDTSQSIGRTDFPLSK